MLKKYLWIFFISMVPVVELRLALPAGLAMGLPFFWTYVVCVIGNFLPVPFLILFAQKVLHLCTKIPKIGGFFQKIIDIGNRKAEKVGKYEFLGIWIFVAIPLPGTGAWTGALVATVLQTKFSKACLAILLGVITSGAIMFMVSAGVFSFLGIR